MEIVRELAIQFNMLVNQASQRAVDQSVAKAKNQFEGLGSTIASAFAFHRFRGFVESQIQVAARLNDISERFGVALGDIQKFSYALEQMGSSAEMAQDGLKYLSKNLSAAQRGSKEATESFAALGVSIENSDGTYRNASEVLLDVAESFRKLGPGAKATELSIRLFGRSGTELIPALTGAGGSIEELFNRAEELGYVLDDDVVKNADRVADMMVDLRAAMRGAGFALTRDLMPRLGDLVKRFADNVARIRKFIDGTNLARYATVAFGGAAALAFGKAAAGVAKVLGFGDGGVLGLGRALLRFAPYVAMIVALSLAFEDLFVFIEGGDSVIGALLTKFLGFEQATAIQKGLSDAFHALGAAFESLVPLVTQLFTMIVGLGIEALPYVTRGLAGLLKFLEVQVKAIASLISGVTGAIAQAKQGNFGKAIDSLGKGLLDGVTANARGLYEGFQTATAPSAPSAPPVPFSMVAEARTPPAYITNNNTITVEGGGGPDVGRRIADALGVTAAEQLRQAQAALGR